jgi:hypothetical protein
VRIICQEKERYQLDSILQLEGAKRLVLAILHRVLIALILEILRGVLLVET